jgi:hypothetical protein
VPVVGLADVGHYPQLEVPDLVAHEILSAGLLPETGK